MVLIAAIAGLLLALFSCVLWWCTYERVMTVGPRSRLWFLQAYQGWISLYQYNRQYSDFRESIAVHWWHVVAFFCLPCLILLYVSLKHTKNAKGQICPNCGYDLRATPDGCPECGQIIAPKCPAV